MENKYFYKTNKFLLLSVIFIMLLVCLLIFFSFVLGLNSRDSMQIFFAVILLPFIIWYSLLFFSVLKERFSGIEFDNEEKVVRLFKKYGDTEVIPFKQISLVKFSVGACIRFVYYTKIEIFTNNNQRQKITILKSIARNNELIQILSSQLEIKHEVTFLLLP